MAFPTCIPLPPPSIHRSDALHCCGAQVQALCIGGCLPLHGPLAACLAQLPSLRMLRVFASSPAQLSGHLPSSSTSGTGVASGSDGVHGFAAEGDTASGGRRQQVRREGPGAGHEGLVSCKKNRSTIAPPWPARLQSIGGRTTPYLFTQTYLLKASRLPLLSTGAVAAPFHADTWLPADQLERIKLLDLDVSWREHLASGLAACGGRLQQLILASDSNDAPRISPGARTFCNPKAMLPDQLAGACVPAPGNRNLRSK